MNNSQFRRLVLDKPSASNSTPSQTPNYGQPTPSSRPPITPMLGSRARSSIPMTPRSVSGYNASNDFALQLAEHKRDISGQPPTKKFKSTAAPKGTKLAKGYQDRTSLRRAEEEDAEIQDDKEKRVKALEEMVKLQQIDQSTFEKLRAEIGIGGDVGSTHLVKGLDWRLLERVKRGEDVASSPNGQVEQTKTDVDDELENVLEKEMEAVKKEERVKKGQMAPPSLQMQDGQKLSRNDILKRLKASRAAAEQAETPPPPEFSLGARFKKVGSGDLSEKKRFVETVNGRRREVLITTDKLGKAKRKVRWLDNEELEQQSAAAESISKPLGMEVPAEVLAKQSALLEKQPADDEDEDIFDGVGANYDPLADVNDDDDSSDGDSMSEGEMKKEPENPITAATSSIQEPPSLKGSRNYFSANPTSTATAQEEDDKPKLITPDPTILAALKRAAAIRKSQETSEDRNGSGGTNTEQDQDGEELHADAEKALRQKKFLDNLKKRDREDAGDLDLGFGESRFGDEEDEDGDGAVWEDGEDGGKEGGGKKGGGGGGRKRGPKKRKGDKNSVNDVLDVLDKRKKKDEK